MTSLFKVVTVLFMFSFITSCGDDCDTASITMVNNRMENLSVEISNLDGDVLGHSCTQILAQSECSFIYELGTYRFEAFKENGDVAYSSTIELTCDGIYFTI